MSAWVVARPAVLCGLASSALLLLGGAGCTTTEKRSFPGIDWEYNSSGLSPNVVSELNAFVPTLETTGLMVVQGGKVVYEYGDVAEVSYIASVRKSVLSMLYGPYVANGTIRLDATVKELGMSDVGGLLPIEERAKVIDLITARSGVYHPASNDGDLLEYAPERGSKEPGSYWLYNNWDFNAAGRVFEQTTGKNIYDALSDGLAIPIGMQDFDRAQQQMDEKPEVSQYPAYTMFLSTRDMARLGYLMLRKGKWGNRQLIPSSWVKRSTSVVTSISELHPEFMQSGPFGYGYMWRVWDGSYATGPYKGAYTASGSHGQWITVLPALDMVVTHKTFWSSTGGPKHNVSRQDFYRVLDLITGYKPATAEELRQWKESETRSTPSTHQPVEKKESGPSTIATATKTAMKATTNIEPRIMPRGKFLVMGRLTPIAPGTESGGKFADIWKDFEARREQIEPHSTDKKYYGVSFTTGEQGQIEYMAGMAVSPVLTIPDGLVVREVPAATYAVFECPMAAIGQMYGHIFSEWRATSGHQIDHASPAFEQYPTAEDPNAPVLIHIPICRHELH